MCPSPAIVTISDERKMFLPQPEVGEKKNLKRHRAETGFFFFFTRLLIHLFVDVHIRFIYFYLLNLR